MLRGAAMNEKANSLYVISKLVEILYEKKLINKATMKEIMIRLQDEQSHNSQNSK